MAGWAQQFFPRGAWRLVCLLVALAGESDGESGRLILRALAGELPSRASQTVPSHWLPKAPSFGGTVL